MSVSVVMFSTVVVIALSSLSLAEALSSPPMSQSCSFVRHGSTPHSGDLPHKTNVV
nr:MAG TPA: hypothetical protein [Caudoviricetes sp.]